MTLSIEILIHISGPSRGSDDARYRREARGLLDFEPAKRLELYSDQEKGNGTHDHSVSQRVVQTKEKTSIERPVPTSLDPPCQLLVRIENTTPIGNKNPKASNSATLFPLPSIIDAGRRHAAIAGSATTTAPPQLDIERTPVLARRRTTPIGRTPTEIGVSHRRTKSDSWKTPPSVIPDSQPSDSSARRSQFSSSPCLKRPFAPSLSPSPTCDRDLPNGKRQRVEELSAARSVHREGAILVDPLIRPISTETLQEPRCSSPSNGLLLEIHPPRPRSSNAHFKTHLTPSLQTLSAQLPLLKYFGPSSQVRSIDKQERGHWLLPIQNWEEALKTKFWEFLSRFIGEGRAGWGVWCSRHAEVGEQFSGSNKENRKPEVVKEMVKVYCWGEIVGEMWLVLFLASERKVKGVGARWIDANKEMVLQMN